VWKYTIFVKDGKIILWWCGTKVVFGWTDLKGFTVQKDGFEGMKVVWLTWFGRMD